MTAHCRRKMRLVPTRGEISISSCAAIQVCRMSDMMIIHPYEHRRTIIILFTNNINTNTNECAVIQGTSKSQLLSYVHKITPRGIYTSGKGSSAVGLTASVVRDPETRSLVLESGTVYI